MDCVSSLTYLGWWNLLTTSSKSIRVSSRTPVQIIIEFLQSLSDVNIFIIGEPSGNVDEDSDFRKVGEERAVTKARNAAEKARELKREKILKQQRRAERDRLKQIEQAKKLAERERQKNAQRKERYEQRKERGEMRAREKKRKAEKEDKKLEALNATIDYRIVDYNKRRILNIIKKQAKKGLDQCRIDFDLTIRAGPTGWDNRPSRKKIRESKFREFLRKEGFKVTHVSVRMKPVRPTRVGFRGVPRHAKLVLALDVSWKKEPVDDFIKIDPSELKGTGSKKNL
jgi:flagellar biosynthesis GTPase FlhF